MPDRQSRLRSLSRYLARERSSQSSNSKVLQCQLDSDVFESARSKRTVAAALQVNADLPL